MHSQSSEEKIANLRFVQHARVGKVLSCLTLIYLYHKFVRCDFYYPFFKKNFETEVHFFVSMWKMIVLYFIFRLPLFKL